MKRALTIPPLARAGTVRKLLEAVGDDAVVKVVSDGIAVYLTEEWYGHTGRVPSHDERRALR